MSESKSGNVQIFTTDFKIRSYEVDHNGDVSISNICNYFQEAAGLQAYQLNFDITDLFKKGLTWVLYQMRINVVRYPKRWEIY